ALLRQTAEVRIPRRDLYEAPKGAAPPPLWIRSLLVLTCTGVSFAHGSNDGQKGMGLIMLILIGTVPTAYALNRAVSPDSVQTFIAASREATAALERHSTYGEEVRAPREAVTEYARSRTLTSATIPALRRMIGDIANELAIYKELAQVPPERVRNFRNDLYIISE